MRYTESWPGVKSIEIRLYAAIQQNIFLTRVENVGFCPAQSDVVTAVEGKISIFNGMKENILRLRSSYANQHQLQFRVPYQTGLNEVTDSLLIELNKFAAFLSFAIALAFDQETFILTPTASKATYQCSVKLFLHSSVIQ